MNKVKIDNRLILTMIFLGMFSGWLCLIAFWYIPYLGDLLRSSESIDNVMAVLSTFGVASVTQVFIVLLTLTWQFFFRKRSDTESDSSNDSS